MNRPSLPLAFSSTAALGAALWAINYRLHHPSLSAADRQFRALVVGADSVQFFQRSHRDMRQKAIAIAYPPLNFEQTLRLIEQIRLLDEKSRFGTDATLADKIDQFELVFSRKGEKLNSIGLGLIPNESAISWSYLTAPPRQVHYTMPNRKLHPRFEKPLRQLLDEFLPNRLQFP